MHSRVSGFRFRHLLLLFTLLPRLVPSLGLMVPIYRLAVAAGLLDKRLTLVIVYTGMLLPLAVWLMVGFFQQIPTRDRGSGQCRRGQPAGAAFATSSPRWRRRR